jgi:AraC-like DNA-binding protein
MPFHYFLKTSSILFYFLLQIIVFVNYYKTRSEKNRSDLYLISWFYIYFNGQLFLTCGLFIDHFTGLDLFKDPYIYSMNMVTIFLIANSVTLLFFPRILYGNQSFDSTLYKKYSQSKLTNPEKDYIMTRLASLMSSGETPFLNPEISLNKLSTSINVSPKQLSQVINEKTGLNFNEYINSFRIDYAIEILHTSDYNVFTIDAIARKAGFNSKTSFYNAFKKSTGLTPRKYLLINKGH